MKAEYLGIFCGLAVALFFFSGDIFYIFLMLIALFGVFTFVGNILMLKPEIKIKSLAVPALFLLVIFYVENIFLQKDLFAPVNTILTSILSISFIIGALVKESAVFSIGLIFKNFKEVFQSIKKYLFKGKILAVAGLVIELILVISIYNLNPSIWIRPLLIIFWAISGVMYVLLLFSDFIIEEDYKKVVTFFRIYGTTRLTYFLIPLYFIQGQINWIVFSFIFLIFYVGLIYGIQPYIFASNSLKDAIKILQYLKSNKNKKVNQISQDLDISKERVSQTLSRLKIKRMVQESGNNRWDLGLLYTTLIKQ
jgi:hypothetical protein